jgi:hypothetical protein
VTIGFALTRIFHVRDASICKAFRGAVVVSFREPLIMPEAAGVKPKAIGVSGSAQRVKNFYKIFGFGTMNLLEVRQFALKMPDIIFRVIFPQLMVYNGLYHIVIDLVVFNFYDLADLRVVI